MNIIISMTIVFFLPGYVISFIFFDSKKIDLVERIALSLALSISVVPLITFYLSLAGARITKANILLEILCIIAISLFIIYIRHNRNK